MRQNPLTTTLHSVLVRRWAIRGDRANVKTMVQSTSTTNPSMSRKMAIKLYIGPLGSAADRLMRHNTVRPANWPNEK